MTQPGKVLRRIIVTIAILVGALFIMRLAIESFFIKPGLKSNDPLVFLRSYMTAMRWGFDVPGKRLSSDVFLASRIEISEPAEISLQGSHDQELQFTVTYYSPWRAETGASPGFRFYFVYAGREDGETWELIGAGTGP